MVSHGGRTINIDIKYGEVGVMHNSELNLAIKSTASEIKRMEDAIIEVLKQFSKEK